MSTASKVAARYKAAREPKFKKDERVGLSPRFRTITHGQPDTLGTIVKVVPRHDGGGAYYYRVKWDHPSLGDERDSWSEDNLVKAVG